MHMSVYDVRKMEDWYDGDYNRHIDNVWYKLDKNLLVSEIYKVTHNY